MDQYLTFEDENDPLHMLRTLNTEPHRLLNAFLDAGFLVAMTDYEGTECVGVGGRTPRCLLGRQTHIRRLCEDRVLYGGCQRDVIWRPGRLPIWG